MIDRTHPPTTASIACRSDNATTPLGGMMPFTPTVNRINPKATARITTTIEKCRHSTVQSYPATVIDRLDPADQYTPPWGNPHSSQYRLNRQS
jgi:hypothetical protein